MIAFHVTNLSERSKSIIPSLCLKIQISTPSAATNPTPLHQPVDTGLINSNRPGKKASVRTETSQIGYLIFNSFVTKDAKSEHGPEGRTVLV